MRGLNLPLPDARLGLPLTPIMPQRNMHPSSGARSGPIVWTMLLVVAWAAAVAGEDRPRLPGDVAAVLSKAGCNAGVCHGNAKGKGGFLLSLRGFDPAADYEAITRAEGGRRVDLLTPGDSLLLRKPTMQAAHQGGKRFSVDSWQHKTLLDWLAAGAPPAPRDAPALVDLQVHFDGRVTSSQRPELTMAILAEPRQELPLRVVARFADDTTRDVTHAAVYEASNLAADVDAEGRIRRSAFGETTVLVRYLAAQAAVRVAFTPERNDFVWANPPANNYIDAHIHAKLSALKVNPAPLCDDATFVRRVYLDLLGLIPTADEAQAFCRDPSGDKRERLIDELLKRPEFSELWALRWSDVLRNEEKTLDAQGTALFHGWMRDSFAAEMPLNQFVRELIASRGSTYKNPPANYWRAMRDEFTRSETTARLFLGVRLQCAKCHNHPFDRWTQQDYYRWAALFARIDYEIVGDNSRKDKLDKHEFVGEQIVKMTASGEVKNPRTDQPAAPKFLGEATPDVVADQDRLLQLADWITSAENDQFARAQANRIWYAMMGRGLVEPIDDFRATNPPSHPELLDALTAELKSSGFDVRLLIRSIACSAAYQRASDGLQEATEGADYAATRVRRLTAEQLLDAQVQVLDAPVKFNGYPPGTRAGQIAGVYRVRPRDAALAEGDRFLKTFGKPERLLGCECERSNDATLRQTLVLLADADLDKRLRKEGGRIHRWAVSTDSDEAVVDALFWTALSRPPREQELAAAVKTLGESDDRFAALQDIAWSVLNSAEFLLRH
ncbi:MAG: DUF1549 domain-containing protein [Planctomycetales bacterium]|nr:DUF1549 domain-containing protein [Planctomycetales bacterium]